jgi:hypothetical protein
MIFYQRDFSDTSCSILNMGLETRGGWPGDHWRLERAWCKQLRCDGDGPELTPPLGLGIYLAIRWAYRGAIGVVHPCQTPSWPASQQLVFFFFSSARQAQSFGNRVLRGTSVHGAKLGCAPRVCAADAPRTS